MEVFKTCVIRLIISCLSVNAVSGAQLTTSPSHITIGGQSPTSQLTIRCIPNAPGITALYGLEIGKKTSPTTRSDIVQILAGNPNITVVDTSLQNRMTQSGSISGTSGSLQIVLTELQCSDASSTYYCSTTYNIATITTDEDTANITARSYPGLIVMVVTPNRIQYDPPVQVEFNCNGQVGNQFAANMANFWVWEWRHTDFFNTAWTRYPNANNITYQDPTPSGDCQYRSRSILTHTVVAGDNGRQFRCYVGSEEYGGNKTISTQDVPVTTPMMTSSSDVPVTTPMMTSSSDAPVTTPMMTSSSDAPVTTPMMTSSSGGDTSMGLGVVIGIAVMLVVDVLVLIVVFIFRRKVAACLSGASTAKATTEGSQLRFHSVTSSGGETSTKPRTESDYEEPTQRHDYADLQTETRTGQSPSTYEQLRVYQNA